MQNSSFGTHCEIDFRWMSQNTGYTSILIPVMAWSCEARRHYLNQCHRLQWVNQQCISELLVELASTWIFFFFTAKHLNKCPEYFQRLLILKINRAENILCSYAKLKCLWSSQNQLINQKNIQFPVGKTYFFLRTFFPESEYYNTVSQNILPHNIAT